MQGGGRRFDPDQLHHPAARFDAMLDLVSNLEMNAGASVDKSPAFLSLDRNRGL